MLFLFLLPLCRCSKWTHNFCTFFSVVLTEFLIFFCSLIVNNYNLYSLLPVWIRNVILSHVFVIFNNFRHCFIVYLFIISILFFFFWFDLVWLSLICIQKIYFCERENKVVRICLQYLLLLLYLLFYADLILGSALHFWLARNCRICSIRVICAIIQAYLQMSLWSGE